GAYMSLGRRRRPAVTASTRPYLVVHGFTDRSHALIAGARAAVTMGGYNSVCELLAARCPALVVPRTVPRMEQAVRAAALAQVGWVDTLHPDDLTPARIGTWLSRTVTRPRRLLGRIDLDGLVHLRQRADALLTDHHVEAEHHAAV